MQENAMTDSKRDRPFYRAVWRWHFYAGLFVIPVLVAMTLSAAVMLIWSSPGDDLGPAPDVVPHGAPLSVSTQAQRALDAVPGSMLMLYVAPPSTNRPAFYQVMSPAGRLDIAIDPFGGEVLAMNTSGRSWRALAARFHSTLFLGSIGDKLIEAACSMAILLVVSGLYLWWPARGRRWPLVPDLSKRDRPLWRELHKSVGVWISLILLAFLFTGLSWTGVWGKKYVKPWSVFSIGAPAEVPVSDLTHAALNTPALREIPWAVEDIAMPASGSKAGVAAVAQPVVLDTVVQWARSNGFSGHFRISLPQDKTGVYTVYTEGLHGVGYAPEAQRIVHIDRYTGNILADFGYAEYRPIGKVMAWAIGLHKGETGVLNYWFNVAYLGFVIFLCLSGITMWWLRRPAGAWRLAAPPLPKDMRTRRGAALVTVAAGVVFPMAGLTLLVVLALDILILSRFPRLKRTLS